MQLQHECRLGLKGAQVSPGEGPFQQTTAVAEDAIDVFASLVPVLLLVGSVELERRVDDVEHSALTR